MNKEEFEKIIENKVKQRKSRADHNRALSSMEKPESGNLLKITFRGCQLAGSYGTRK